MCYRSSEDDMETYGTGMRLKSLRHSSNLPLRTADYKRLGVGVSVTYQLL
jgi:hypothetical protein